MPIPMPVPLCLCLYHAYTTPSTLHTYATCASQRPYHITYAILSPTAATLTTHTPPNRVSRARFQPATIPLLKPFRSTICYISNTFCTALSSNDQPKPLHFSSIPCISNELQCATYAYIHAYP